MIICFCGPGHSIVDTEGSCRKEDIFSKPGTIRCGGAVGARGALGASIGTV